MSARPMSAAEFAEAVITHWPPFRWDQHQAGSWTQSLVREIGNFDRQVLGNALAHLIRTRRDTKTPTVAACIDACVAERRFIDAQSLAIDAKPDISTLPPHAPERRAHADLIVKCPLGKQAAREGWIGSMHAFAVENGRLPLANATVTAPRMPGPHPNRDYIGMTEIEMCKRQAKDFDTAYATVVRGEIVTAGHQKWSDEAKAKARAAGKEWESTGAAMLKERQRLANTVLEAQ